MTKASLLAGGFLLGTSLCSCTTAFAPLARPHRGHRGHRRVASSSSSAAPSADSFLGHGSARAAATATARQQHHHQHQNQHQTPHRHHHSLSSSLNHLHPTSKPPLSSEDAWIADVDVEAFGRDMRAIGRRWWAQQGDADVAHLRKMCRWSNACGFIGLATMGFGFGFGGNACVMVNPLAVVALSLWTFSRWATIAHHACHGGYNNCRDADPSGEFHSKNFAVGSLRRRVSQWFDWMLPEAWSVEHNELHHYRLGEEADPDLVQRNLAFVRAMKAPKAVKYLGVAFLMMTWKWFYYAPNTYKELVIARMRRRGEPVTPDMRPRREFTLKDLFLLKEEPPASSSSAAADAAADAAASSSPAAAESSTSSSSSSRSGSTSVDELPAHRWYTFGDFFRRVMGPYLVGHFLLLPLPLLLAGRLFGGGGVEGWAVGFRWFRHAVLNLAVADLLTNAHAFVAIMPNHCGDDLYAFGDRSVKPNSGTFYLRQVVSSSNFRTVRGGVGVDDIDSGGRNGGGLVRRARRGWKTFACDANDFLHGWLNYGIEHHLFPNLSALSARRCHEDVKACCAAHGVPYVQQGVWRRLRKTVDVMVGDASMRQFPAEWERPEDRMVWSDQREPPQREKVAAAAVGAPAAAAAAVSAPSVAASS